MNHRIISTRRQVVNEQDRYGGYQSSSLGFSGEIAHDAPAETDAYADFRVSRAERGLDRSEYGYQDWSNTDFAPQNETAYAQVKYSQRAYPKQTEYVGVDISREESKIPFKKRNTDDVMPTIKSQAYVKETTPRQGAQLSASAKTTLVIYIAAIIVLSIVVIATGIAINSAQSQAEKLQADLSAKLQLKAEQDVELDKLSDPVYVAGLALGDGMEKISSYEEVQLMNIIEPEAYESETGWFDHFCGWLSGFFGG